MTFLKMQKNRTKKTRGAKGPRCRRQFGFLLSLTCFIILALLSFPGVAGPLRRPNSYSPLALGIGGAGFSGVSNPTTIYYNPAGMTLSPDTVALAGLEIVSAPRTYEPLTGPEESSESKIIPLPSVGITSRFTKSGDKPLPFAAGLGFFVSYGGAMDFDKDKVSPGIVHSQILLMELNLAFAYAVTPTLSLGAALRLGLGSFSLINTERRGVDLAPADLSGSGIKAGYSLGATYMPAKWLRLGITYASPMTVAMEGDGQVEINPNELTPDLSTLTMPWPQWAAFGIALAPTDNLNIYTGLRWTDWSAFQRLVIDLSVIKDVVEELNFDDGVTLNLGAEWSPLEALVVRAGFSYDSNCVPDTTVKRQYLDSDKFTLALGGSYYITPHLALDVAYEILFGPTREVPNVIRKEIDPITDEEKDVPVNPAPGRYSSTIHSIALGGRYSF